MENVDTDNTRFMEMHLDPTEFERYTDKVLFDYARLDVINIACIVTEDYLFELLIFYASVCRSWSFYPWRIVVFSPEADTVKIVHDLGLVNLESRLLSIPHQNSDWASNAALKVSLVEYGGLERAIVSDVDNVFVAETPELDLFLDRHDFVYIGAPHTKWIVQTSLWGFKRTDAAIKFCRKWARESRGRKFSDASGFPFALHNHTIKDLSVLVLAKAKKEGLKHHACPYDIQANIRPFEFKRDLLGYYEKEMGRAKVVHFGGLRAQGAESVPARMRVLQELFPESAAIFPYYVECANFAAKILGKKTLDQDCPF